MTSTRVRTFGFGIPAFVVGAIALGFLVNWIMSPSAPSAPRTASVQTTQQQTNLCDNTYRPYQLINQSQPLPGRPGCRMGWNIEDGGIYLIDQTGMSYGPYYKGSVVSGTPTIIAWRAVNGNAVVNARFY